MLRLARQVLSAASQGAFQLGPLHSSFGARWFISTTRTMQKAELKSKPFEVVTQDLAQPGEGIAECTLLGWHVEEGQSIDEFDNVCDVQSDKATIAISSKYSGQIVKLHGKVDDVIQVGAPLFDVAVSNATFSGTPSAVSVAEPDFSMSAGTSTGSSTPPSTSSSVNDAAPAERPARARDVNRQGVLATPAVRRVASEQGVDLAALSGSGPEGRVLKCDVLAAAGGRTLPHSDDTEVGAAPTAGVGDTRLNGAHSGIGRHVPLQGYRRAMVRSMTESLAVPLFHFCDEVQLDALLGMRQSLRASGHATLTLMPFFVKALSVALSRHPEVNARLGPRLDTLHVLSDHNIGIAMATPAGLVAPCVKRVQTLSVLGVAEELARLRRAASEAKLAQDDLSDATISLSNIGSIGGTYATPIVTPPEIAICALGRMKPALINSDGQIGTVMNISWGADHRALDGAALARFSNDWKLLLQEPSRMLLSMA